MIDIRASGENAVGAERELKPPPNATPDRARSPALAAAASPRPRLRKIIALGARGKVAFFAARDPLPPFSHGGSGPVETGAKRPPLADNTTARTLFLGKPGKRTSA
jgi:hypothetical protein